MEQPQQNNTPPTPSDTTSAPLKPAETPSHGPIDVLRDHLQQSQVPYEEGIPREEAWSRTDHFYRFGIIFLACVLSISIGMGVVFAFERPTFVPSQQSYIPTLAMSPSPSPAPTGSPRGEAYAVAAVPSVTSVAPTVAPASTTPVPSPSTQVLTSVDQTQVQPSVTAQAIVVASPSSATSEPLSATVVLQRVIAAEAALRSGQFEAVIDYGGGNRSSAQVRFDDSASMSPRFHILSTYEGKEGKQTVERITIDEHSWQRAQGSSWTERSAEEGIADQIHVFLPHAEEATQVALTDALNGVILQWYDSSRDVDVKLTVDATTGVPYEQREVTRSTGAVHTVTYTGWNSSVAIVPPK